MSEGAKRDMSGGDQEQLDFGLRPVELTRFGGALRGFKGGFTDAQDPTAVFPGVSPSDG